MCINAYNRSISRSSLIAQSFYPKLEKLIKCSYERKESSFKFVSVK